MTSVSYAQNYEDVVLARVLADVAQGHYIDVGAHDPRVDSVTCAFYERGWRGINIEPVEHWYQRLLAARPDDLNLCLAVGDHAGMLRLYEIADSGLSTVRADIAARHHAAGLPVQEREVAVQSLDAICRDAICQDAKLAEVHFLKIDAEGAESDVLRGFSFRVVRPWVVLVEATEPNTRVPAFADWEPFLLDHDYDFAYADGINRFYLARERAALAGRFGPPTVLDDFVRREQVDIAAMLYSRLEQTDALARGRAEAIDIVEVHARAVETALASANAEQARLASLLSERDTLIAQLQSAASSAIAALESAEAAGSRLQSELSDATARSLALEAEQSLAASHAQRQQLELATLRLAHTQLSMLVPNLEAELRAAVNAQAASAAEVSRQLEHIAELHAMQSHILGSRSWRLTAPLRALHLRVAAVANAGARLARALARALARIGVLRGAAALAFRASPDVKAKVRLRLYGPLPMAPDVVPEPELTEDAQRILRLAPILPAPASSGD